MPIFTHARSRNSRSRLAGSKPSRRKELAKVRRTCLRIEKLEERQLLAACVEPAGPYIHNDLETGRIFNRDNELEVVLGTTRFEGSIVRGFAELSLNTESGVSLENLKSGSEVVLMGLYFQGDAGAFSVDYYTDTTLGFEPQDYHRSTLGSITLHSDDFLTQRYSSNPPGYLNIACSKAHDGFAGMVDVTESVKLALENGDNIVGFRFRSGANQNVTVAGRWSNPPITPALWIQSPLPDLKVQEITSPTEVIPGEPFDLEIDIANNSSSVSVTSPFDVEYLVSGDSLDSPRRLGSFRHEDTLDPGESFRITREVTLPQDLPKGDYEFSVVLDSGDAVDELLEVNNSASNEIEVLPSQVNFSWLVHGFNPSATIDYFNPISDSTDLTRDVWRDFHSSYCTPDVALCNGLLSDNAFAMGDVLSTDFAESRPSSLLWDSSRGWSRAIANTLMRIVLGSFPHLTAAAAALEAATESGLAHAKFLSHSASLRLDAQILAALAAC